MNKKILYLLLAVGIGIFALKKLETSSDGPQVDEENLEILLYGELGTDEELQNEIAEGYGFQFNRVAGCEITASLCDSVERINAVVEERLLERNGNDWKETFQKDFDEALVLKNKAKEIKMH